VFPKQNVCHFIYNNHPLQYVIVGGILKELPEKSYWYQGERRKMAFQPFSYLNKVSIFEGFSEASPEPDTQNSQNWLNNLHFS
jgi:hypothetical protein